MDTNYSLTSRPDLAEIGAKQKKRSFMYRAPPPSGIVLAILKTVKSNRRHTQSLI